MNIVRNYATAIRENYDGSLVDYIAHNLSIENRIRARTDCSLITRQAYMDRLVEESPELQANPNLNISAKAMRSAMDIIDEMVRDDNSLYPDVSKRALAAAKIAPYIDQALDELLNSNTLNPTSPEGYAKVMADPALQEKYQDTLDAFFQERIVSVRNELRKLDWKGDRDARLAFKFTKNDGNTHYQVSTDYRQIGAGANVVATEWCVQYVSGYGDDAKSGVLGIIPGDLMKDAANFALSITEIIEHTKTVSTNLLKRASDSLQDYCEEVNGDMNDSLAMEIYAFLEKDYQAVGAMPEANGPWTSITENIEHTKTVRTGNNAQKINSALATAVGTNGINALKKATVVISDVTDQQYEAE